MFLPYPHHRKTRRFWYEMTRKLSVTRPGNCPLFGDCFSKERQEGRRALPLGRGVSVPRDVLAHDDPEPLDRVEVRAAGRQLDQMDAALGRRWS